jgi:hypothetical protein
MMEEDAGFHRMQDAEGREILDYGTCLRRARLPAARVPAYCRVVRPVECDMAEPKTQKTKASVKDFIAAIEDESRRRDVKAVDMLMREITGEKPVMWGAAIVGYGTYTAHYANGKTVDWMIVGFSPRKSALTLYIMPGFDRYEELMARLGKHTTGKSCLYLKKLADVDIDVLRELITESVAMMRAMHAKGK